ncbi:nitroreductase [Candidatus Woesearchaeota archaeon]|nr:nitroreductase [Candidatus Woesearchaeota archaeon]
MDLKTAITTRRSVRRFKDKPVSMDLIRKLVESATYAPTNCNQQLWKFVAVTDPGLKERLVKEAFSSTIVRRAPVVLVACYDGWSYKEAIQGASFAAQNLLLEATALGLGVLSMNSFGNEEVIKRMLDIPDGYVINCFILVGYPDEVYKTTPVVSRRPVDEVLSINKFGMRHATHRSYDSRRWTVPDLVDFQRYYCRKTFLGKRMDVMDDLERELVKRVLQDLQGKAVLDLFSYDGAYLDLFPKAELTSVNLDPETERYVAAAAKDASIKGIEFEQYDGIAGSYDAATMMLKAERLPPELRKGSFSLAHEHLKQGGTFVIVSRVPNLFFTLFYRLIIGMFGDDVRRTGIYAFWGPYRPVRAAMLRRELRSAGFIIQSSRKHFIIPAFFNQALQMFIQFRKSGGSSYLHRDKHVNILTRILEGIIGLQGLRALPFGSVVVLRARKP